MQSISYPLPIQPLLFTQKELSSCFFFAPTEDEIAFMEIWENIVSVMPAEVRNDDGKSHTGRPGYPLMGIIAVHAVKLYFQEKTLTAARERLLSSVNLRTITGMGRVPSLAVISKRTDTLIELVDFDSVLASICSSFYGGRMVCNLSIDSTIAEAREKPVKAVKERKKRKQGRKKKGSEELTIEQEKEQMHGFMEKGDVGEFLSMLEHRCSLTGKKNSKGNMEWFIGYKAHLAVDDSGIIVAHHVTGACVHDSQVAIPLMRMADGRCDYLYALMDGGYTSERIEAFASTIGKVPIIDSHADRNGNKKEMEPCKAERYKARTTVERTNSELKECFLPAKLYSRGKRGIFQIELSILMLDIKKILERLRAEEEERAGKTA